MWAGVAVGVLAAIPFALQLAFPSTSVIYVIVAAATGLIYVSYFMNNIASLMARLKGWPREKAPFSLGRWGVLINVLALVYGGVMIINFLWFGGLRDTFLINPYLSTAFTGLANVPLLGRLPIFETFLILLFGTGAIYWFGFKRRSVIAIAGAGTEKPAEALAD